MAGLREEITKRFMRSSGARRVPDEPERSPSDETSVPTDPREGRQFGSYRILRRLGSGGMGHVYLALDTRLGRHAALKFLPAELLSDELMLQRLEQEARTASALNHPNILTIYEIGNFDGELFIASEFVDGVTLKKAIQRNAVDPEMAIRVATQIASALMAAHSAGVIHRDLKPDNVMVRRDGYVKVIDFGLAKLTEESVVSRMKHSDLSMPGSVVGTVNYMSPEQARGEAVDPRTDLWSLGVLLYEMLAHKRPFSGETDSHVIVAILDHAAPPLPNIASLPPGAASVVQRALMKDPAKRYQSAQAMLAALEQLGPLSTRRRPVGWAPERVVGASRSALIASGLVAFLLAAAAVWWWGFSGKNRFGEPDWFRVGSVRQVTFNGRTQFSAISPDGKYLAFVVGDPGGMASLHVKQLDQASDEVRIPSRKISYLGLTFSPDSRAIYEVEEEEERLWGKLFAVPVVGDRSSTPLLEDIDGPVSFSPSGDRFAFVRYQHPEEPHPGPTRSLIEVASAAGSGRKVVLSTADYLIYPHVAWSPKRDVIAAVIGDSSLSANGLQLDLIGLNKRESKKPLPQWNGVSQLWWSDTGRKLILSASSATEPKSRAQLRELSVGSGQTREIVKDLSGYGSVTLTQDGRQLAVVKSDSSAAVWLSGKNDWTHGRTVYSDVQDSGSLAWIDEDNLVVNSRRTGYPNLAILHAADQSHSSITDEPFMEQHAAAVPGAKSIVFSSNRTGAFHLWRFDLESKKYIQLTSGSTYDDTPSVSSDGQWVAYTAWSGSTPLLFKISLGGGTPIAVGPVSAVDPQISPDGKWVACSIQKDRDHWAVALVPFDANGPIKLMPKVQSPFRWSPGGDALITSITDSSGVSNLWRVPLDNSSPKQLTDFDDESILTFAWSTAGDRIACLRLVRGADVVLYTRENSQR